jgi:copper homeostasis protein (lipoprotein)
MRHHPRIALVALVMLACGPDDPGQVKAPSPTPDSTSTATGPDAGGSVVDWAGTYHGTVPCADCDGIDTWITLNKDLTFHMERTWAGKSTDTYMEDGSITWDAAGSRITLNGVDSTARHYLAARDELLQLDQFAQRIMGDEAERYRLVKQANPTGSAPW